MAVERIPIRSRKSPDTTDPWYEFELDVNPANKLRVRVVTDNDKQSDVAGAQADLATADTSKPLVLSVTETGLEVWEQAPENVPEGLLSNVAYWMPDTETLRVLDFEER